MLSLSPGSSSNFFFFNDTATTEIYTLSLHDALPIYQTGTYLATRVALGPSTAGLPQGEFAPWFHERSEEHTSELQSLRHLVCRLLLEKKKKESHQSFDHAAPKWAQHTFGSALAWVSE